MDQKCAGLVRQKGVVKQQTLKQMKSEASKARIRLKVAKNDLCELEIQIEKARDERRDWNREFWQKRWRSVLELRREQLDWKDVGERLESYRGGNGVSGGRAKEIAFQALLIEAGYRQGDSPSSPVKMIKNRLAAWTYMAKEWPKLTVRLDPRRDHPSVLSSTPVISPKPKRNAQ